MKRPRLNFEAQNRLSVKLQIAQPGGAVAKLKKSAIIKTEPMTVSLMPPGLDKALTADELRDLMTYFLTEPKKGQ